VGSLASFATKDQAAADGPQHRRSGLGLAARAISFTAFVLERRRSEKAYLPEQIRHVPAYVIEAIKNLSVKSGQQKKEYAANIIRTNGAPQLDIVDVAIGSGLRAPRIRTRAKTWADLHTHPTETFFSETDLYFSRGVSILATPSGRIFMAVRTRDRSRPPLSALAFSWSGLSDMIDQCEPDRDPELMWDTSGLAYADMIGRVIYELRGNTFARITARPEVATLSRLDDRLARTRFLVFEALRKNRSISADYLKTISRAEKVRPKPLLASDYARFARIVERSRLSRVINRPALINSADGKARAVVTWQTDSVCGSSPEVNVWYFNPARAKQQSGSDPPRASANSAVRYLVTSDGVKVQAAGMKGAAITER
jgi:hypothetical protein